MAEYLKIEEVADLLHSSRVALYSQRSRGLNPGALGVLVGRRVIFRKDDIDRWFDSQHDREEVPA